MEFTSLTAISPVDGRYRKTVADLGNYFSEYALIKYRVFVEIEYFVALYEIPLPQLSGLKKEDIAAIRNIHHAFNETEAEKVKATEKVTNHDVKAVEYYIKSKFDELKLQEYKEFIHFGLTSQDINNTAVPLSVKHFVSDSYLPEMLRIIGKLKEQAEEWKDISMLARTHGQPASPTKLGKEMLVFVERLNDQLELMRNIPVSAKFGGATGNFNAHWAAYPQTDWISFANSFLKGKLGLARQQITTQIEHYDHLAALFDCVKRINTILTDLNRDFWTYISMEYFKQKIKKGEVGSSAMPHKVNPIDFENSEGNLGIANAIFEHLSAKLPVSRLQRDLTDSTVLRNVGVPFAHTIIALKSLGRGLDKLMLNQQAIKDDLEKNWIVISEAIQTILRREGYPNPYEALKALTRTNQRIGKDELYAFINDLDISEKVKTELKKLNPSNYTGKTENV